MGRPGPQADSRRHVPGLEPYAFAGTPFFANPEVAWLSPFSLPLWILPLHYAFGLAAALKLWMAGFGTYLLVRELRLGFWPGIVAGVGLRCVRSTSYGSVTACIVAVAVLLPWPIWLVERAVRCGRGLDGSLAVVAASVLAGGHPGTQVHVLAARGRVRAAARRGMPGLAATDSVRRLALVAAALLLGAAVDRGRAAAGPARRDRARSAPACG